MLILHFIIYFKKRASVCHLLLFVFSFNLPAETARADNGVGPGAREDVAGLVVPAVAFWACKICSPKPKTVAVMRRNAKRVPRWAADWG